jgi:hypothetical protein
MKVAMAMENAKTRKRKIANLTEDRRRSTGFLLKSLLTVARFHWMDSRPLV